MEYSFAIEYSKEIAKTVSQELLNVFPDADIIEVNSFGADTIVQALVTIVPTMFASSAVTVLITKLIMEKIKLLVHILFSGADRTAKSFHNFCHLPQSLWTLLPLTTDNNATPVGIIW